MSWRNGGIKCMLSNCCTCLGHIMQPSVLMLIVPLYFKSPEPQHLAPFKPNVISIWMNYLYDGPGFACLPGVNKGFHYLDSALFCWQISEMVHLGSRKAMANLILPDWLKLAGRGEIRPSFNNYFKYFQLVLFFFFLRRWSSFVDFM